MEKLKKILLIFFIIILILVLFVLFVFLKLDHKTKTILDDYSSIYSNEKYLSSVYISDISVIKQDISCGYAVIEMFAKWTGNENLTEKSLFDSYGKVVTSTGNTFETEMNKQFPNYKTKMYKYLKNTELIDKVYESLKDGIPVPIEWAAKYNDEWTLHYSLVIGLDVLNDVVTILNPYGYIENITIKEFLGRTSFEAYENMPIFFKLAFAFGIFEKNTIFIVEEK